MSSILIIDHTVICRELLGGILRLKGYEAYPASDAREALGLLREHAPDLVVLDLELPEMDGLAVLRILRSNPQYKDIRCIVLTAVTDRDCVLQARKLGAHDYLLKTHFSLQELMTRITRILGTESAESPEPGPAESPEPGPAESSEAGPVEAPPAEAAAK